MTIYDLIYEEINDRYENGELTLEQANEVNDLAYERYMNEATRLAKEIHKAGKKYTKEYSKLNKGNGNYDELKKAGSKLYNLGAGVTDLHRVSDSIKIGKKCAENKALEKEVKKHIKDKGRNYHPDINFDDFMVELNKNEISRNADEYRAQRDGKAAKDFVKKQLIKKKQMNESVTDEYTTEGKLFNKIKEMFKHKKGTKKEGSTNYYNGKFYYEETIGKYYFEIASVDRDSKISDEAKNEARQIIKNFNFSKFENQLNKFVKSEYDKYNKEENTTHFHHDEKYEPIKSLQDVLSSRGNICFFFNCKNNKLVEYGASDYDIWVSYRFWAGEEDDSILCPEVEVRVKSNNKNPYNFYMHLG